MSHRNLDDEFKLRNQMYMGQTISARDQDYARYSGAYIEDALEMASIDHILRTYPLKPIVRAHLKNRRLFLDLKRKAYFASIGTDIFSKLAFILGDNRKSAKWSK